eukprot:TRINITY_DN111868_c0_g1_i1.p1 TRINITY_DN111868_c0_g1~~TRINITY_DN111868_c0_g1_i1.p1  ORF type:complete len:101 (-),score=13.48 TRINITY_DN111868_c0_g1_i1:139-402(-)
MLVQILGIYMSNLPQVLGKDAREDQNELRKTLRKCYTVPITRGVPSPFAVLERWMEVMGYPLKPVWVRLKGGPLQVWHEDVFPLLGD